MIDHVESEMSAIKTEFELLENPDFLVNMAEKARKEDEKTNDIVMETSEHNIPDNNNSEANSPNSSMNSQDPAEEQVGVPFSSLGLDGTIQLNLVENMNVPVFDKNVNYMEKVQ